MYKNLRELMLDKGKKLGEKPFFTFEGNKYSFAELDRESNRVANALLEMGIGKDDKVCVMLANRPEFLFIWFGLAKIGAVLVPINIYLKGESLEYIIKHSDAETLIIEGGFYDQIASFLPECNNIRNHICIDAPQKELPSVFTPYETMLQNMSSAVPPGVDIKPGDIMSILYTSGTTGPPKGVMLSHYSYINTGKESGKVYRLTSEDIAYTCLPLFHVNAQQLTTMACLVAEIPMILVERFSLSRFWQEIKEYQATVTVFIGSMASMLFKQAESPEDGENKLRAAACAAMPKDIWLPFEERFKMKIIECYGLTETSTLATANPYEAVRIGSIGKPVSYADVAVWGDNNNNLPPGGLGEIVVKGKEPHVLMEGYYKMKEKTEEAMHNGWFKTGDRGYADEDGYLYFKDRIKDCIRRRGENISSFEIEKIVNAHPQVLESAAVGVPSEFGEEDVKLSVVLKAGEVVSPEELHAFCRDKMSYFMVPRYVEIREALPKTSTQRIQKFVLKEEGTAGTWDSELYRKNTRKLN